MTVGNKHFAGKGAREEAARALTHVVLSWRDDTSLQKRATFRGFEILSRGRGTLRLGDTAEDDRMPELFVRGETTYTANLNPENPVGTVQSIEHVLRSMERHAENDREHIERLEKTQADYQAQAGRPYEHEAKLKELLARQAQLNAALDLDKGERQIAEAAEAEQPENPLHGGAMTARLEHSSSAALRR